MKLIYSDRKQIRGRLELEVEGRIDCKGSRGGDRNVMHFDCGGGYMDGYMAVTWVYICQNPLNCAFNMGAIYCT